jgi:hypothetical protein
MLRVDPSIRASVPEIFSHVWMRTTSQTYDPHLSTVREKNTMSPLSLIRKLSLNNMSSPPGTESQKTTARSSVKVCESETP